MLEFQEHLETFLDKKDHAAECVEGMKTSLKLQMLKEEEGSDSGGNETVLDLGRALFKLHFHLFLLLETAHKMLTSLLVTARTHKARKAPARDDAAARNVIDLFLPF